MIGKPVTYFEGHGKSGVDEVGEGSCGLTGRKTEEKSLAKNAGGKRNMRRWGVQTGKSSECIIKEEGR